MNEKEKQLFEEIKEFLKEFDNGDYSTGDAMETLNYFYEKVQELEEDIEE